MDRCRRTRRSPQPTRPDASRGCSRKCRSVRYTYSSLSSFVVARRVAAGPIKAVPRRRRDTRKYRSYLENNARRACPSGSLSATPRARVRHSRHPSHSSTRTPARAGRPTSVRAPDPTPRVALISRIANPAPPRKDRRTPAGTDAPAPPRPLRAGSLQPVRLFPPTVGIWFTNQSDEVRARYLPIHLPRRDVPRPRAIRRPKSLTL